MNIKILIATNNEYRFPEDEMYLPIQAGSSVWKPIPGIQVDNTGDHISKKNPYFCELTALYWGWKNLDCDYLGLCHYRRHFAGSFSFNKWERVLKKEQAEKILENVPVIVTKKRVYAIESLYSHYGHTHHSIDLKTTRKIISEKCPEYIPMFDTMMKRTSAHMFNMAIMRKDILDEYCKWLFDILDELEIRLDTSSYSDFDKRVFGRISELLLDVWLYKNNVQFEEVPLVFMENQHWILKVLNFLRAKFLSGKEL